ncbi:MAG: ABC transporter substrate-binding protein [Bacillota bacterium]|nr:ABC transporter substrate-binding protein [Bacillota bacterium]
MRKRNQNRWIFSLFVLIMLGFGVFSFHQYRQAVYTASLDTRPLNVGVVGDITTLHPALMSHHSERVMASALYEGLLTYDQESTTIQPFLAKSWKYAPDGKSMTLYLKEAAFSNGKKVTASLVKASWEKNFMVTKEWSNISMFLPIVGAEERLNGKTQEITGIKAINDKTLKIEFKEPHAAFAYVLTNAMFWVMDESEGTELGAGTGPYVLQQKMDNSMMLIRNEQYHRGLSKLTAIHVQSFQGGSDALNAYYSEKLDYLDEIPSQQITSLVSDPKYKQQLIEKPIMEVYWLGFNLNREPFVNNYMLRRAINYAIDRETMIKKILGGGYQAARGVIPEGTVGFNQQIMGYHYNKEKAEDLLAEAGYPGGQGLKPLTLTYNSGVGHQQIVAEVVRQLGEIGVVVEVQEEEWDVYKKHLSNMSVSFFRLGWVADYPDADNYLFSLFHSSKVGVSNLMGYRNPQVDRILDASRAEYRSPEERIKLMQRAEQIIIDDAPCVFLFQKKGCKLVSQNVRNLNIDCMEMIDWYQVELAKPDIDVSKPGKAPENSSDAQKI